MFKVCQQKITQKYNLRLIDGSEGSMAVGRCKKVLFVSSSVRLDLRLVGVPLMPGFSSELCLQYQIMNYNLSMRLLCQRNLTGNVRLDFLRLYVFRHHGPLSTCSCRSAPPVTSPPSSPPSSLFLRLSSFRLPSPFHRPAAKALPPPTTWRERKGRPSGAPWTSSAWRASSRGERVVCW